MVHSDGVLFGEFNGVGWVQVVRRRNHGECPPRGSDVAHKQFQRFRKLRASEHLVPDISRRKVFVGNDHADDEKGDTRVTRCPRGAGVGLLCQVRGHGETACPGEGSWRDGV